MVGVLDDVSLHIGMAFGSPDDAIVLLGDNTDELGGSEYLKVVHGLVAGDAPRVDLDGEKALQEAVLEMVAARLLRSAHDCAEGGLAVCLAESAFAGRHGIDARLDDSIEPAPLLFGEAQGRIVVSCARDHADAVLGIANVHGVPARRIGKVTSGEAEDGPRYVVHAAGVKIDLPVSSLAEVYESAIPRLMEKAFEH
jgi:phosphoribosylformylglycinamidine synthase